MGFELRCQNYINGQWCTATSRLIIEDAFADVVIDKVPGRVQQFRLGAGADSNTTMGPVCGKQQLTEVLEHIELAWAQGARLLSGFALPQGGRPVSNSC